MSLNSNSGPLGADSVDERGEGAGNGGNSHLVVFFKHDSPWARMDTAGAVLLAFLAIAISVFGAYRAPSLSALDEVTHLDYVWKLAHGEIPRPGSELAPWVLEEWSCRSQDNIGDVLPACGAENAPEEFPASGINYNHGHPPLYYALTAGVTNVVQLLPVDLSFTTVARLTGGAWLAAAMVGLYVVLRRTWGTSTASAAAAAVLLGTVPSVAHASSIVTNDAPAALAGVAALWMLGRVAVCGEHGWIVPATLTLIIASTKVMTAIAPLAVAVVVAVMAFQALRAGDHRTSFRLILMAASMVVAVFAVFEGWSSFQEGRIDTAWVNPIQGVNTSPVTGHPLDEWLPTAFDAFGIAQDYWLQTALTGWTVVFLARLFTLIFTVAPFAAVVLFERHDSRRLVGWTALVGAVAVPVVVQLQTFLGDHYYFPYVSGRYAMALIPVTIASLALVAEERGWGKAFLVLALAAYAVIFLNFTGMV